MRWNDRKDWIWSEEQTHEPIVTIDEFDAAQRRFGTGKRSGGGRHAAPGRRYVLRGHAPVRAVQPPNGQGNWNHDRPHYRCRFTDGLPSNRAPGTRRAVYVREDAILPALDRWLGTVFDPENLDAHLRRAGRREQA